MRIQFVKGSWDVDVFLDRSESGYKDNVFLRIQEKCPEQWRLLRASQITVGLTAADALRLGRRLVRIAKQDEATEKAEARAARGAPTVSARKRRPAARTAV